MRAFRLRLAAAREDEASLRLWEAGTTGFEVRADAFGLEILAYFPATVDADALRALLPGAEVEPAEIPSVDWVARFREGFRAFRAGRFHVVPAWELPAHRERCACRGPRSTSVADRDVLVVDPGRAFGTGTHETTRLCLAAVEDLALRRPLGRTLDLGAGTGLLAIAAARLGAGPVVASDIDEEATASSRVHANLNGSRLQVVRADGARGLRPGRFDLVLANLMALLLVERMEEIRALVARGGALVLSGLLREDAEIVARAFAPCGTPRQRHDGEWCALVYEDVR